MIGDLQKLLTAERLPSISGTGYGSFVEQSIATYMLIAPGMHPRDTMDNSIRTNISNIYNALESRSRTPGPDSTHRLKEG